ncbi:site-2 protease family protein [Bacillus sp. es.034]|uniref:site-2 protease family protein n=1 Tax=Bacillus sp. es.034 TaxID=1761763 RepID=UPI000C01DF9C|nr:site-2 protease family protein [Bacillus sp. es.034]PFG05539.1 stage IV sporulation protein FB [Bacillus sp. es.034]
MINILSLLKKFYVHPLLWLVIGIAIMTAHFFELILLLVIITIHELGHGLMAQSFSWRVKKIALLPFGGVAEMDEHGNRSLMEEFWVVTAGPLQHVWLIAVGFGLLEFGLISQDTFSLFFQLNMMVLLFNLLPIWPLDGGKLVSLLLATKLNYLRAYEYTLLFSFGLLLLFHLVVLIIAPLHLNLWIVLSFLYFSLWVDWKQRRYAFMKFLLERYYGKSHQFVQLRPLPIESDESILTVVERFQRGVKHPLVVFEKGVEVGKLDENELLHAFFAEKMTSAKTKDLLYLY